MKCFLCLQKSETIFDIYQGMKEGFVILNIPDIIEKHVCFKPDKTDPMLCSKCWGTIESFYIFCLTIKEAHKNLDEIKNNVVIKCEQLENVLEEDLISNDHQNYSYDENESICSNTDNGIFAQAITKKEVEYNNSNNDNDSKAIIRPERNCVKKSVHKKELNNIKKEKETTFEEVENNEVSKIKKRNARGNVCRNDDAVNAKIAKYMTMTCDICGEVTPTFGLLKTHFRIAHQQKGYTVCCGRKFKDRHLLIDHIDCHLNPDHFKCKLCDKTFAIAVSLKKHFKNIHCAVDTTPLQCDQCSKTFTRKPILLRHKAYHLPVESWKFPCEECDKVFPSRYYLTTHKTFTHNTLPTKICYVCGKSVQSNQLKQHMRKHDSTNKEEKVECEICKAKLNKKYINLHRQHHEEAEKEEFFCPICNHKSPTSRALYMHKRYTHAEQRNHECKICHKTFKRKLSLKQHMGTHTGTPLYSCPYCPRTFTYDSNFYLHKKREHPKEIEIEKQKQKRTNFIEHKEKSMKFNQQENLETVDDLNKSALSITIKDF